MAYSFRDDDYSVLKMRAAYAGSTRRKPGHRKVEGQPKSGGPTPADRIELAI